jgi:hypothetical protein
MYKSMGYSDMFRQPEAHSRNNGSVNSKLTHTKHSEPLNNNTGIHRCNRVSIIDQFKYKPLIKIHSVSHLGSQMRAATL